MMEDRNRSRNQDRSRDKKRAGTVWPKRCIWLVSVMFALFMGARIYYRCTDDFRISNLTRSLEQSARWYTPLGDTPLGDTPLAKEDSNTQNFESILAQRFDYLGKGAQSYAFLSEDGAYVLKFFKSKHFRLNGVQNLLSSLPFLEQWRMRKIAKKRRLLESVFSGYKLAFKKDRENAGMLYLHLTDGDKLEGTFALKDKMGFAHKIPRNAYAFTLQRCAKITRAVLTDALKKGDTDLALCRFNQIVDLYLDEYQKGIYDRDHGVLHNTGFVGERPIHLDVGKLSKDSNMMHVAHYKPDLIKVVCKFKLWVQQNYPGADRKMTEHMELRLTEIFGEPFSFSDHA